MHLSTLAVLGQSAGRPTQNLFATFVPLLLVFVIFYFLLIRPQRSQQKKHQQMLANVRKGDQVITRGGIHGKIVGIAENILTVEIADNVRVKLGRDALVSITPSTE